MPVWVYLVAWLTFGTCMPWDARNLHPSGLLSCVFLAARLSALIYTAVRCPLKQTRSKLILCRTAVLTNEVNQPRLHAPVILPNTVLDTPPSPHPGAAISCKH